jgi:non-specific serine/threonine protein kinase/serine/threonine-protein kinase
MNSDKWQKINELFHAAIERAPQERESFLKETCSADETLFQEVGRLVEAHDKAGDFIQEPALPNGFKLLSDENEKPPIAAQQFGVYKIIEEIGRGGMGMVYLAERADGEFAQRVAIKIIKRGMDTEEVLRRFRRERQILASLEHPNIARLLDGGTTEDGLPYFVMEYVEGEQIDRFCDSRGLSVAERLNLFRQVCAVVAYAHQRLVIHRDLKPSNIIISKEGEPKLLDFGIAKLMHAETGDGETIPTAKGMLLMTPEYASPEQAQGLPVTTLTDVYSLGVILYELLSGRSPYQFKDYSPIEILLKKISGVEPPKPSDAAKETQENRDAETQSRKKIRKNQKSETLNPKSLRGDLDNIILKAMRKEPSERYASAGQFSEDIRRHLAGLPVIARPVTFSYRLTKFVQRNKAAVGAAALLFLILIGGIITTTWQASRARQQEELARIEKERAEKRFNDVRKLARAVLFDYHDAIENLPGSTEVRARLVQDALSYLDSLAAESGNDASLQHELADAYEKLAQIQGGSFNASLGDTAAALESRRKALEIREALAATDPQDIKNRKALADGYKNLGATLRETNESAKALEYNRKALAIYQSLADENAGDAEFQRLLAKAYNAVGSVQYELGDFDGAYDNLQKSLEITQSIAARDAEGEEKRRSLSTLLEEIGYVFISKGDPAKALEYYRKGLEIRTRLSEEFPLNTDYRNLIAVGYYNIAEAQNNLADHKGALESNRRYAAIVAELAAADPKNAQHQSGIAFGHLRIGDQLLKLGSTENALAEYRKALPLFVKEADSDPVNLWKRAAMIEARTKLGMALALAGEMAAANEQCAKTFGLMNETPEITDAYILPNWSLAFSRLGETHAFIASNAKFSKAEKQQQWQKAREMFTRSLQIWENMQRRGVLDASAEEEPRKVVREIERCDLALKS